MHARTVELENKFAFVALYVVTIIRIIRIITEGRTQKPEIGENIKTMSTSCRKAKEKERKTFGREKENHCMGLSHVQHNKLPTKTVNFDEGTERRKLF